MTDVLCVFTTTDSQEEARSISKALVERRLAACVQVQGPIASTYWWQGSVEQSNEWLCACKTTKDKYVPLESAIRELHSYDEPEIIALPVVAGSASYLAWLRAALEPPESE